MLPSWTTALKYDPEFAWTAPNPTETRGAAEAEFGDADEVADGELDLHMAFADSGLARICSSERGIG